MKRKLNNYSGLPCTSCGEKTEEDRWKLCWKCQLKPLKKKMKVDKKRKLVKGPMAIFEEQLAIIRETRARAKEPLVREALDNREKLLRLNRIR